MGEGRVAVDRFTYQCMLSLYLATTVLFVFFSRHIFSVCVCVCVCMCVFESLPVIRG